MKEISDKTEACIKLVAEELKHKEMTTAEIKQKYKMSRSEFLNLLNILTFRINLDGKYTSCYGDNEKCKFRPVYKKSEQKMNRSKLCMIAR